MQLLRQRAGREGEVFVVGQAVVDSAVGEGRGGTTFNDTHWGSMTLHLQAESRTSSSATRRKQKCKLLGAKKRSSFFFFADVLALVAEAEVRSLVEEHAHAVVGELVAEAVLVRVVDPLGHPQKGLGLRQTGRVPAGCQKKKKKKGGGLKNK